MTRDRDRSEDTPSGLELLRMRDIVGLMAYTSLLQRADGAKDGSVSANTLAACASAAHDAANAFLAERAKRRTEWATQRRRSVEDNVNDAFGNR